MRILFVADPFSGERPELFVSVRLLDRPRDIPSCFPLNGGMVHCKQLPLLHILHQGHASVIHRPVIPNLRFWLLCTKEKFKSSCASRFPLFTGRDLHLSVINLFLTHRCNVRLIDACHYPVELKISHDLWLFISCAFLRCAQVKPRFFFILCYSDIRFDINHLFTSEKTPLPLYALLYHHSPQLRKPFCDLFFHLYIFC